MLNDSFEWQKSTYNIMLGNSFSTYQQVVAWTLQDDHERGTVNDKKGINELVAELPAMYTKQTFTDSSVGGNDAINPVWGFNVDDDITHPLTASPGTRGMGRVYSEMYDANQQILWMTMGVPKFCGLKDFYLSSGGSAELSGLMNNGEPGFAAKLGNMLGEGAALAFLFPVLPVIWMYKILDRCVNQAKITKYFDFKSSMVVYYRMVNTILSELAVGMGLYKNGLQCVKHIPPTGGNNEGNTLKQYAESGVPAIMVDGPDIFAIVNKRIKKMNVQRVFNTDQLLSDWKQPEGARKSWFDGVTDSIVGSALGGGDFVGFRIEKSTDTSETVSNQSGPSEIASKINGKASEMRNKKFGMGGLKSGVDVIDASVEGATSIVKGALDGLGVGNVVEIVSGNGYMDIPDTWQNSTFTKNYSFNIQLRARYGDPVTIYQSLYIPLAMLVAAAFPRSIGTNTYTSPFLVRCYCKGMFAIPCGMIESMTIKRGASEFGWTNAQLPTAIDISLNIKDLSPAMFISLGDMSIWDIFNTADGLAEYINTLSGIGLVERFYYWPKLKKKFFAWTLIKKNTLFSSLYWANVIGRGTLPKAIAAVTPWTRMANR